MSRRFEPGWSDRVDGIRLRAVRGDKLTIYGERGKDVRLDVFVDGEWRALTMALPALLVDFFYENEDVLYPPPQYKGGRKFLGYLRDAAVYGWQKTYAVLRAEKALKPRSLFDEEAS